MTDSLPHLEVTLVEPEKMNLLGLILSSAIRRRLTDPSALRHGQRLSGQIKIEAGGMTVGLSFGDGTVRIQRGAPAGRVKASIRGTLTALVDAALSRRRVSHFLRGDLRAWGRPLTLWHLLHLIRASGPQPGPTNE